MTLNQEAIPIKRAVFKAPTTMQPLLDSQLLDVSGCRGGFYGNWTKAGCKEHSNTTTGSQAPGHMPPFLLTPV